MLLMAFLSSCTTVQNKADELIEKEDKYLEKFLNKKKIKFKSYNFKNTLKFKDENDLLDFYRSTVFYDKKSEKSLSRIFRKSKKRVGYFNILKSAKLYKFKYIS